MKREGKIEGGEGKIKKEETERESEGLNIKGKKDRRRWRNIREKDTEKEWWFKKRGKERQKEGKEIRERENRERMGVSIKSKGKLEGGEGKIEKK